MSMKEHRTEISARTYKHHHLGVATRVVQGYYLKLYLRWITYDSAYTNQNIEKMREHGGRGWFKVSVVRGGLSQVVSRVVETKDFLRGNLKPALLACFRLIRSHWGLSEH